jgi:GDP-L-fucose synthase
MPTNLYGPGDNYHPINSHVLPSLIRRFHEAAKLNLESTTCWGTGTPMREFLHVDDLGEACVFALENWSPNLGELSYLNVGTGVDLTIRELAEAVAQATGFTGRVKWDASQPDGTPKKQLDVSRLANMGWRARIPLAEGLDSTVSFFRHHLSQKMVRL